LEGAAILVVGALAVLSTIRETAVVRAGSAGACNALLSIGTCCVEAGEQAFAVDADSSVTALEVELATERHRSGILLRGFFFERVEAQAARGAGRSEWALVLVVAPTHTADGRADLVDGTVGLGETDRALRRRLRIAFVPSADEAATVAQRTVGDTDVSGVVVAAGDPE
jgi:hypothetical protein